MIHKIQDFLIVNKDMLLATHLPNVIVLQHKDENPQGSEQKEFQIYFMQI